MTANAKIGTVNISGYCNDADIVASVTPGGGTYFGNTGDSTTNGNGTIGTVTIGFPTTITPEASATFAIEAANLGTVTVGGNVINTSGTGSVIYSGFTDHVRIRTL